MSQPSACRKTSGQETSTEVLTGEPDTSKGCLSGSEGRQRYSFPKGKESRALPYITEALNLNFDFSRFDTCADAAPNFGQGLQR